MNKGGNSPQYTLSLIPSLLLVTILTQPILCAVTLIKKGIWKRAGVREYTPVGCTTFSTVPTHYNGAGDLYFQDYYIRPLG